MRQNDGINSGTNLNGLYHTNDTLNNRQIAYCGGIKNCFERTSDRYGFYRFNGEIIKLKDTMIFLSKN